MALAGGACVKRSGPLIVTLTSGDKAEPPPFVILHHTGPRLFRAAPMSYWIARDNGT